MSVELLTDAASTYYAIERRHFRNAGVIGMPVYGVPKADSSRYPNGELSPTPIQCKIVRLHAPIEWWEIRWVCVKEGAAPIVPNPYLFDKNLTFKQGQRSGTIPVLLAGYKGHAWSMSGLYEYLCASPTDLNSDMPLGLEPWEPTLADPNNPGLAMADSKMPGANFVTYLLENLQLLTGISSSPGGG